MYLLENPVLQRELIVNLRRTRSFVLLFLYVGGLAAVVAFAWPESGSAKDAAAARQLLNVLFVGQFVLASLLAPTFAAGAISGEKERKTFEMLLASPLQPAAVLTGKLLGALFQIGLLIFSALPVVVLCLPLGGMSVYEVLAAYTAMLCGLLCFGAICLACSAFFTRTLASLLVSYLLMLPCILTAAWLWFALDGPYASWRLIGSLTALPLGAGGLCLFLFGLTTWRMRYPPDLTGQRQDALLHEQPVSSPLVVLRRDKFPDYLLSPEKRSDLMEEGINPVYDKEMRSEVFSQGAFMLRVVLQISIGLAVPLMAVLLYGMPWLAPWYISYVLLFNIVVGPVFSATSMTSEHERQTLDLLLTTTISPGHLLWGKLLAGLRVSGVLTSFLCYPILLSCVTWSFYWRTIDSMAYYLAIIATTIVTTSTVGMLCSIFARRTSVSLTLSYLTIGLLYVGVPAAWAYAETFFPHLPATRWLYGLTATSPFCAVFGTRLDFDIIGFPVQGWSWPVHQWHLVFYLCFNLFLLLLMAVLFRRRWRIAH